MSDSKAAQKSIRASIKEAGKPSDLQELELSEVQIDKITPEIKELMEKCTQLKVLRMAECNLSSLDNFPSLPNLEELDVSSNSITDKDLKIIATNCQKLKMLSIGDNQISAIASLKVLKPIKNLQTLWSEDNPIASDPTYTKVAFATFKDLYSLDGKDSKGKQIQEDFQQDNSEEDGDFQEGGSDEEQEDQDGQGQEGNGENEEEEEQDQEQEVKPKKKKR